MSEVDNLEIKVEATSRGANQQLKILIGMMDELSAKLNGMNTKNFESLATLMKSLASMNGVVKQASNSLKETTKDLTNVSNASKRASEVIANMNANASKIGRNIPLPTGLIEQKKALKSAQEEFDRLIQRQEKYIMTGRSTDSQSWINLQYDILNTTNKVEDLKQAIQEAQSQATQNITFDVTVPKFDKEKFDLSDLILSQNVLGMQKTFENFGTTVNSVFNDVKSDIDSTIAKTVDLSNVDVSSVFNSMKIKDGMPAEIELIAGKYNKLREELLELENVYNNVAKSSKNFTDMNAGETPVNVAQQTVARMQKVISQMTSLKDSANNLSKSIAKPFENMIDTSYLSEMNIKQLKEELKNVSAELKNINSQVSSWKDNSGNIDFKAVDENTLEDMNYYQQLIPEIKAKISDLKAEGNKIDFSAIKRNADINIKQTGSLFEGLYQTIANGKGEIAKFKNTIQGSSTYGAISGIFKTADVINNSAIKGFTKLRDMISDISSKFIKLGSAMSKPLAMMLEFGGVGIIRKGFEGLNNALKNTYKQLVRTSKMFSLMLLRKGLRAVIDNMTNSFNDLARQSSSVNASVSSMVSNFRWLGASITAAFSPIYNVVAPILDALVEKCVSVINTIGQVFASLTGNGTYTYAKKVQVDYAGSLDDTAKSANNATKAVKEYENQLMGFDEINKLSDNKGSGSSGSGGSSGGAGASGYDYVFDTAQVESQYNNWADMIKEAWKDGDFTEIGEIVGQKLADALDSINWDKIQTQANKIAKSTATFINGAMHSDLFSSVGTTIGQALTTAFGVAYTFVDKFEFDTFGKETAKLLNNAFANTSFSTIAKTISTSMNGVFETVYNFSKTFKWSKNATLVVNGIKDALNGIDWEKGINASGELGKGLANAINSIFTLSTETKDSLGKSLGKSMAGALNTGINFLYSSITNINFKNVGQNIADVINNLLNDTDWEKAGVTFSDGSKGILEIISTALKNVDKDKLTEAFKGFFSGVDWLGIAEEIAKVLWESLKLKLQLKFETPIITMQGLLDGIIGKEPGTGAIDKIWDSTIGELWRKIKDSNFAINVKGTIDDSFTKVANTWNNLKAGTKNLIANARASGSKAIDSCGKVWNKIKSGTKNIYLKAKASGQSAIDKFKKTWNGLKSKTLKLGLKISGVIGNVKEVLNEKIIRPLNKKLPKIFPKIPEFAMGGYPNMGQMFIAREKGPELVGKIGTRNAVVNNNQIVEGVANGVYNAVVSAMATVGNNGGNININLVGDAKKFFKVVQQEGRNYQKSTGLPVF